MDRRRFLLTSLAGVLGVPLGAEAQQAAKVFKVGELNPGTGSEERLAALREAGYVEGRTCLSNAGMQRHPHVTVDQAQLAEHRPHMLVQ